MKSCNQAWSKFALAAGAWALLLLAVSLEPAGAAEQPADAAATQPGVKVTGKVKVAVSGAKETVDLNDCAGMLVATPPQPPEDVVKKGDEAIQKWFQEWQKTPDGVAQMQLREYRQEVTIGSDGRFTVAHVPAGKLTLLVAAFNTEEREEEPGKPKKKVKTDLRGQTTHAFAVSAQDSAAGKTIDLGTITLTLPNVAKVGGVAPDFTVKTLDGKKLSLKETRGKVVLLDFWATWCGPCRAELPYMKSTYEKFGKNPKFIMISLSLDNDIAVPRDFVKQNGMGWTQGFLGNWEEDKVTKTYGVNGIPATFLLNPEGKIIAKDLRGERVSEAVGEALKAKPETTSGTEARNKPNPAERKTRQ